MRTVYFAERDDLIKIGCSGSLRSRMADLGASFLTGFAGDFKDEQGLHSLFAADRLHGEWFRPSDSLLDFIAALPPYAPPSERPLTSQQVADIFGVTAVTVASWADTGKLPYFRTPGNHRRFWRADVEHFLRTVRSEVEAS